MNGKKTPLMQVKDEHGGKAKLVDKVLGVIERGEEDAAELKDRLLKASNKKLLRLLATQAAIKDKYGSPAKLAEAIGQKLGKAKDADFMRRLGRYTPARLLDMARSLAGEKRRPLKVPVVIQEAAPAKVKAAAKRAVKKPVVKKPATKKAAAKKAAAKKATSKSKTAARKSARS
jgi:hypothetical protein